MIQSKGISDAFITIFTLDIAVISVGTIFRVDICTRKIYFLSFHLLVPPQLPPMPTLRVTLAR